MKFFLISLMSLSFFSINAYAECGANGCFNVNVTKLYIANNGKIYVDTSGNESLLGCTSPGNTLMTINNNLPSKNAMYSALLTAKTTKTKVFIRTLNKSPICEIAYITINE